MVMAGTILYLFKEFGYQNFIFFVHTDAIIQKTRENLLNPQSPKYLFSHELEIDGEKITIAPVDIFPSVPERNTIYLKLSTIHKMHDELNSYRENSITYEDLKEIPLVLLGDEAHHFNAGTKASRLGSVRLRTSSTCDRITACSSSPLPLTLQTKISDRNTVTRWYISMI